jgi:hypothetical protein
VTAPADAGVQCLQTVITIPCIAIAIGFYTGFFALRFPDTPWLARTTFRRAGVAVSLAVMVILNVLLARLI